MRTKLSSRCYELQFNGAYLSGGVCALSRCVHIFIVRLAHGLNFLSAAARFINSLSLSGLVYKTAAVLITSDTMHSAK